MRRWGECKGWMLLEREDKSTPEWRSLRLIRTNQSGNQRRSLWLGHNGQHLAHNADAEWLAHLDTYVYQWINDFRFTDPPCSSVAFIR